ETRTSGWLNGHNDRRWSDGQPSAVGCNLTPDTGGSLPREPPRVTGKDTRPSSRSVPVRLPLASHWQGEAPADGPSGQICRPPTGNCLFLSRFAARRWVSQAQKEPAGSRGTRTGCERRRREPPGCVRPAGPRPEPRVLPVRRLEREAGREADDAQVAAAARAAGTVRLRRRHRAEASVLRTQTRLVELPVDELRVAHALLVRVRQLQLGLPAVPVDDAERVEHVEAQLQRPAAAEADVPRDRQVELTLHAAPHPVAARLHADAAAIGTGDHVGVELAVLVARATRPRVA